jgi:lipoic acid synthetase
VTHGTPLAADENEPVKVASAIHALGLAYVVVTSVDRDDLQDFGATQFARTITETRSRIPSCRLEVLIPDFQGGRDGAAHRPRRRPRRPQSQHRDGACGSIAPRVPADLQRALDVLRRSKAIAPAIATKSGLMVGLGEEWDEVVATLQDLREAGVNIVTIGQYLRPSVANLPMVRYYTPAEFAELKRIGLELGFRPC